MCGVAKKYERCVRMPDKKFTTDAEFIGGRILEHVSQGDVRKLKAVSNKRERLVEIFVSATSRDAQDRILSAVGELVLPALCSDVEVSILLVKPESSVFQSVEDGFEHLEVFVYHHSE